MKDLKKTCYRYSLIFLPHKNKFSFKKSKATNFHPPNVSLERILDQQLFLQNILQLVLEQKQQRCIFESSYLRYCNKNPDFASTGVHRKVQYTLTIKIFDKPKDSIVDVGCKKKITPFLFLLLKRSNLDDIYFQVRHSMRHFFFLTTIISEVRGLVDQLILRGVPLALSQLSDERVCPARLASSCAPQQLSHHLENSIN